MNNFEIRDFLVANTAPSVSFDVIDSIHHRGALKGVCNAICCSN